MKDLIEKIQALRNQCENCGDKVSYLLGISTDVKDPRTGCFAMIFNHSTLSLELLAYYYGLWQKPSAQLTAEAVEEARKQNWERCNELLKSLFVMAMSSIEYSAKASAVYYGRQSFAHSLLRSKVGFVYLSNIIKRSEENDLLNSSACRDWEGLIAVRNCVVHNNTIPHRTENYVIEGINIVATEGIMLQGKLDFFAILTKVAVNRYFDWVTALIQRCQI
jgi:hypothetical protein